MVMAVSSPRVVVRPAELENLLPRSERRSALRGKRGIVPQVTAGRLASERAEEGVSP